MDQNGIIARQVAKYRAALGWTAERLSRESGLELAVVEGVERGGIGLTVEDLIRLATALDVTPGTLMTISHPLEAEWTCDAWDILTAVERGHRAQVDVKGKLAEYFLHEYLRRLETMLPGLVVRSWNDIDGEPDFDLVFGTGSPSGWSARTRGVCRRTARSEGQPSRSEWSCRRRGTRRMARRPEATDSKTSKCWPCACSIGAETGGTPSVPREGSCLVRTTRRS
jgi:transcriptional regulator with XRE-family HTH domain